ncbi:hypothetical protein ACFLUM_02380 [Chloroflexota bacterium]
MQPALPHHATDVQNALAIDREGIIVEIDLIVPGVLTSQIAAISLGLVDGQLLLDLCYEEDSAATADFNVVMTGAGQLVEIQGTAEGATFDRKVMDRVLDLAEQAIGQLVTLQRQVLNAAGEAA